MYGRVFQTTCTPKSRIGRTHCQQHICMDVLGGLLAGNDGFWIARPVMHADPGRGDAPMSVRMEHGYKYRQLNSSVTNSSRCNRDDMRSTPTQRCNKPARVAAPSTVRCTHRTRVKRQPNGFYHCASDRSNADRCSARSGWRPSCARVGNEH